MTRADGASVRIDTLKEGDEIMAATADGSLTTGVLSLLSIAHPEADVDNFLTLTTAANASVTLTHEHHLHAYGDQTRDWPSLTLSALLCSLLFSPADMSS